MSFLLSLPNFVLKRLYKFILKRVLGSLLCNEIDTETLDVAIGEGRIALQNLSINTDLVNDAVHGAPIVCTEATIEHLQIHIPWTSLLSKPCQVSVTGISIILCPSNQVKRRLGGSIAQAVANSVADLKHDRLLSKHLKKSGQLVWVNEKTRNWHLDAKCSEANGRFSLHKKQLPATEIRARGFTLCELCHSKNSPHSIADFRKSFGFDDATSDFSSGDEEDAFETSLENEEPSSPSTNDKGSQGNDTIIEITAKIIEQVVSQTNVDIQDVTIRLCHVHPDANRQTVLSLVLPKIVCTDAMNLPTISKNQPATLAPSQREYNKDVRFHGFHVTLTEEPLLANSILSSQLADHFSHAASLSRMETSADINSSPDSTMFLSARSLPPETAYFVPAAPQRISSDASQGNAFSTSPSSANLNCTAERPRPHSDVIVVGDNEQECVIQIRARLDQFHGSRLELACFVREIRVVLTPSQLADVTSVLSAIGDASSEKAMLVHNADCHDMSSQVSDLSSLHHSVPSHISPFSRPSTLSTTSAMSSSQSKLWSLTLHVRSAQIVLIQDDDCIYNRDWWLAANYSLPIHSSLPVKCSSNSNTKVKCIVAGLSGDHFLLETSRIAIHLIQRDTLSIIRASIGQVSITECLLQVLPDIENNGCNDATFRCGALLRFSEQDKYSVDGVAHRDFTKDTGEDNDSSFSDVSLVYLSSLFGAFPESELSSLNGFACLDNYSGLNDLRDALNISLAPLQLDIDLELFDRAYDIITAITLPNPFIFGAINSCTASACQADLFEDDNSSTRTSHFPFTDIEHLLSSNSPDNSINQSLNKPSAALRSCFSILCSHAKVCLAFPDLSLPSMERLRTGLYGDGCIDSRGALRAERLSADIEDLNIHNLLRTCASMQSSLPPLTLLSLSADIDFASATMKLQYLPPGQDFFHNTTVFCTHTDQAAIPLQRSCSNFQRIRLLRLPDSCSDISNIASQPSDSERLSQLFFARLPDVKAWEPNSAYSNSQRNSSSGAHINDVMDSGPVDFENISLNRCSTVVDMQFSSLNAQLSVLDFHVLMMLFDVYTIVFGDPSEDPRLHAAIDGADAHSNNCSGCTVSKNLADSGDNHNDRQSDWSETSSDSSVESTLYESQAGVADSAVLRPVAPDERVYTAEELMRASSRGYRNQSNLCDSCVPQLRVDSSSSEDLNDCYSRGLNIDDVFARANVMSRSQILPSEAMSASFMHNPQTDIERFAKLKRRKPASPFRAAITHSHSTRCGSAVRIGVARGCMCLLDMQADYFDSNNKSRQKQSMSAVVQNFRALNVNRLVGSASTYLTMQFSDLVVRQHVGCVTDLSSILSSDCIPVLYKCHLPSPAAVSENNTSIHLPPVYCSTSSLLNAALVVNMLFSSSSACGKGDACSELHPGKETLTMLNARDLALPYDHSFDWLSDTVAFFSGTLFKPCWASLNLEFLKQENSISRAQAQERTHDYHDVGDSISASDQAMHKFFVNIYDCCIDYNPAPVSERLIVLLENVEFQSIPNNSHNGNLYKLEFRDIAAYVASSAPKGEIFRPNDLFHLSHSCIRISHSVPITEHLDRNGYSRVLICEFMEMLVRQLASPSATTSASLAQRGRLQGQIRPIAATSIELKNGSISAGTCHDSLTALSRVINQFIARTTKPLRTPEFDVTVVSTAEQTAFHRGLGSELPSLNENKPFIPPTPAEPSNLDTESIQNDVLFAIDTNVYGPDFGAARDLGMGHRLHFIDNYNDRKERQTSISLALQAAAEREMNRVRREQISQSMYVRNSSNTARNLYGRNKPVMSHEQTAVWFTERQMLRLEEEQRQQYLDSLSEQERQMELERFLVEDEVRRERRRRDKKMGVQVDRDQPYGLKIVEDYIVPPEDDIDPDHAHQRLQLHLPTDAPDSVFELLICDLNISWALFGGHDFSTTCMLHQDNTIIANTSPEPMPHSTSKLSSTQSQLHEQQGQRNQSSIALATVHFPETSQEQRSSDRYISGAPIIQHDYVNLFDDGKSMIPSKSKFGESDRKVQSDTSRFADSTNANGRRTDQVLELHAKGFNVRYDEFGKQVQLASRLAIAVSSVEIIDCIETSSFHKLLSRWRPPGLSIHAIPPELQLAQLRIELLSVRPDYELHPEREEYRMRLGVSPLRIYADQDAVEFIINYAKAMMDAAPTAQAGGSDTDKASAVSLPSSPKVDHDTASTSAGTSHADAASANDSIAADDDEHDGSMVLGIQSSPLSQDTVTRQKTQIMMSRHSAQSSVFVQCFQTDFPIRVCIDYAPKRFSMSGFSEGDYGQLVNLFPLEGVELELVRVKFNGLPGWGRATMETALVWANDISTRQAHRYLAGVQPIRSLVHIGSGVADLLIMPLEHYKRRGRFAHGVKHGAASFLKNLTSESVGAAAHFAHGVQTVLQSLDDLFEAPHPASTFRVRDFSHEDSPSGAVAGLFQAYTVLSHALLSASHRMIVVPRTEYVRAGFGPACRSALRSVPLALLRPMIGTCDAVRRALLGVAHTIDPHASRERREKRKSTRRRYRDHAG